MGEVAIRLRVMPDDAKRDLSALEKALVAALPKGARFGTAKPMPIGFGLSALDIAVIVSDRDGGSEDVEARFASVEGVESVTVVEVGLI